jgi:Nif-specific regulatory protein
VVPREQVVQKAAGNGVMTIVDDQLAEQVTAECAALEAIVSVLAEPGALPHKIAHALELIQDRLRLLQSQQARRSGAEVASVTESGTVPWRELAGRTEDQNAVGSSRAAIGLIGHSPAMRLVNEAIFRVSDSQATVLLRGESGTGKELVARAIHRQGPRADKPFVPLHCAAVSETLLESELFGHERGAFTGAVEARKGRFELADGGTLFLDEIGDIPLGTQVKSATHRDLEAMVHAGTFREDLYYRLNVVPITVPPLRERDGDVLLLIDHFLSRFNRQNARHVRLGRDVRSLMARYHWPGNVRELQNCVERLVVMVDPHHEELALETIPSSLRGYFSDMRQVTTTGPLKSVHERAGEGKLRPLSASLQEIERDRLMDALKRAGWVQAKAARALGLTARQVAYKMRKYGIREGGEEGVP